MNDSEAWLADNQRLLSGEIAALCGLLERHRAGASAPGPAALSLDTEPPSSEQSPAFALDALCADFGLSAFERQVVLLAAAMELDARVPALCAAAHGQPERAYPTFGLALAALPSAHWSALLPSAPLRRFRLIELERGELVTQAAITIDERILHFLCGISNLDERLASLVLPVASPPVLPASLRAAAERAAQVWSAGGQTPLVELCGPSAPDRRAVAALACSLLGIALYRVRASELPQAASERESFARLWDREAVLARAALLLELDPSDTTEHERSLQLVADRLSGPVFVSSRDALVERDRAKVRLELRQPTAAEQVELWRAALGQRAPADGHLNATASRFNLGASAILAVSEQTAGESGAEPESFRRSLWQACRQHARPRFDDLAQRIDAKASWDDLVLPEPQRVLLQQVARQVRHRVTVYDDWGFAEHSDRGMGITALFAGASGTGKTLAAEVLARELELELYRIDLSRVVSKYIGETEKNLKRVFDAADAGSVVLLFDEADALFGKRTEVKDSHDRHANIEIGYLLQRMEAYRGLAILTTNLRNSLDEAFLRRIRFVVDFPFPDAQQREHIWRRMFPPRTPTDGLDLPRLARLNVAGGNIRNIALNAAFLAADSGEPVRMPHVMRAVQTEYEKLERQLPENGRSPW